jgi:hypothetical protein
MSILGDFERLADTDWWAAANEIMFLIMLDSNGFTEDDFYRLAREVHFTPHFMEEAWNRLLYEFKNAGYIRKTDKTLPSERGCGQLRVWERATE